MRNMKKIVAMLLALLMCAASLASCGDGADGGTPASDLSIIANGASDYKIVFADAGEAWEELFAKKVSTTLNTALGVKLDVVADTAVTGDASSHEIVIATAKNTRPYMTTEGIGKGYAMSVDGNRLIMEVGSKTGAYMALYQLVRDQFGVDIEKGEKLSKVTDQSTMEIKSDYKQSLATKSSSFPYLNCESVKIVHGDKYSDLCLGVELQSQFKMYLKEEYNLYKDVTDFSNTNTGFFNLKYDPSLTKGDWTFSVSGNVVTCTAGDYQGLEAAVSYIDTFRTSDGYYILKDGETKSGNYVDGLGTKDYLQTSKYTYNRQGDIRVMFNNVLWGSVTNHPTTDKPMNEYPIADRTQLFAEWVTEYMPDVLGLQEVDISRRGGKKGSDGKGGVIAELETLGYKETLDPRVRNAYEETEKIPGTDASLTVSGATAGTELDGYGVGGASTVTVGGETYYTYYNCTPLFYNTATTKLVTDGDGNPLTGYYWYKSQWDKITGAEHENGAGDCASKALTWGIFESLETGDRYIAISTHMCTRSDFIRGLQAKEVKALVDELTAEYDYPVFFGGDMNGNNDDSNYKYFADEEGAGFHSLQDYRDPETNKPIASVYTSPVRTTPGYPNYDHNNYVVIPGGTPTAITTAEGGNSIDQIYVTNYDAVDIKLYGVVTDLATRRSADHMPLLVEFTFKK